MKRSVLKFGGSSVADADCIARVAKIVDLRVRGGDAVAVVVSAMGGKTDELLGLAGRCSHACDAEDDTIVSSGEQVCAGLLAIALRSRGCNARSWLGWQIGMRTTGGHGRARIASIEASDLLGEAIDGGQIAVIAGFQGVNAEGRITTLGRGGTDTSAVAIAVALGTGCCDIYTDVDGVYTADPRIVASARRIGCISHEEMLELASLGSRVLQTRSVELAMTHGITLRVVSSFDETSGSDSGTLVCRESDIMEKSTVTGIAYSLDEARVSLFGVNDAPGTAATVFGSLAAAEVNVDMIVQARAQASGRQNMVFTVGQGDTANARKAIEAISEKIGCTSIDIATGIAKVSIVGIGMRSHTGVAATMFETLAGRGINIQAISTSEIKISILVDAACTELAVRALHDAYGLDAG